jgi:hypothetical protein
MDSILHIIYINLEHRTDRKQQIELELSRFKGSVERLNATPHAIGGIGCSMSHIRALQRAKQAGWPHVLILEDDAMFTNIKEGDISLSKLISEPYDVILLCGAYASYNPSTCRVISSQTATAYLVHSNYYDTLISNFKSGLEQLIRTNIYNKYALDQYWKLLQPRDKWYIVLPTMCIQRPSYSDIEKKNVDYTRAFI